MDASTSQTTAHRILESNLVGLGEFFYQWAGSRENELFFYWLDFVRGEGMAYHFKCNPVSSLQAFWSAAQKAGRLWVGERRLVLIESAESPSLLVSGWSLGNQDEITDEDIDTCLLLFIQHYLIDQT